MRRDGAPRRHDTAIHGLRASEHPRYPPRMSVAGSWWALGLMVAACGGHSTSNGDDETERSGANGSSGAAGTPSAGSSTGGAGSGTGAAPSDGGGISSSGGSAECPSLPEACTGSPDRVQLEGVRLLFPGAGSCGACTSACVECETLCTLPVVVTPHCTGTRVHLFACSTPEGEGSCLNTTSDDPYYVDSRGKRWSVVTLSVDDAQDFMSVGVVKSTLSLTITDGTATRVVPVAVHGCNLERLRALPC